MVMLNIPQLSREECNAIVQTVMDLSSEVPQYALKSREQCSIAESNVYADAQRLIELPPVWPTLFH